MDTENNKCNEMILNTSREIKNLQNRLKKIFPKEGDNYEIILGQPKEIDIMPVDPVFAKLRISDPLNQGTLNFIIEGREQASHLIKKDLKVLFSAVFHEPSEKHCDISIKNVRLFSH